MKLLLTLPGIVVRVANVDGNTPLHTFVQKCTTPEAPNLVEAMLIIGTSPDPLTADPTIINLPNNFGERYPKCVFH